MERICDTIEKKKDAFRIILMESIKDSRYADKLYKLLDKYLCDNGVDKLYDKSEKKDDIESIKLTRFYIFMISVVCYVIYEDMWCEYFEAGKEETWIFITIFIISLRTKITLSKCFNYLSMS